MEFPKFDFNTGSESCIGSKCIFRFVRFPKILFIIKMDQQHQSTVSEREREKTITQFERGIQLQSLNSGIQCRPLVPTILLDNKLKRLYCIIRAC